MMLKGCKVTIEGVSKFFGHFQVLNSIDLTIQKGEFFSLLGPSGCGKTTLLRLIAGFEAPSSGALYFDDSAIHDLPPNERHVNTVFQTYALFPHLSVFENIAFGLRLKKLPQAQVRALVDEYLSLVKLSDHAYKNPHQLSGGQKQRVAIARALVNKPDVLLLDEPLSALDAKLRQQLLVELDLIHDQVGITFIYVTHDQQEALGVSDRIAIMKDGQIVQVGTSRDIYQRPVNEFAATFIGETNLFKGRVNRIQAQLAYIDVPDLGEFVSRIHSPLSEGDMVQVSIRPELIEISKNRPIQPEGPVLEGIVDEIVYSGFQSKLFVKVRGHTLRVFQHHCLASETLLTFNDRVNLSWDIDDCYMICEESAAC